MWESYAKYFTICWNGESSLYQNIRIKQVFKTQIDYGNLHDEDRTFTSD